MRKLTLQEVNERIKIIHNGDVWMIPDSFKSVAAKATFKHKDYDRSWETTPDSIMRGGSHPQKAHDTMSLQRRMPIDVLISKIFDIYGHEISLDNSTYQGIHKPARFIDRDYPNIEWRPRPANLLSRHDRHPRRSADNRKKMNIQKYGVEYYIQSTEFREKSKESTFKALGVEYPIQNPEVSDKMMKTMLERHGVEYYTQHPEFQAKQEKTNIERYGFPKAMQNPEISFKAASSSGKITLIPHWETGELLRCQGSYELLTIQYWNLKRESFVWQKTFRIPDHVPLVGGLTYRIDAFLVKADTYVEIKGCFRPGTKAKDKWDWFHRTYPNSELWDRAKLKSMGIQVK